MNKLYFRAWLPKTKEMSKVDSINFRGDNNKKPYVSLRSNNISVAYLDEIILMQGIEIDGKVVYEGDIVEVGTIDNGYENTATIESIFELQYIKGYDDVKVIGNIYEKEMGK